MRRLLEETLRIQERFSPPREPAPFALRCESKKPDPGVQPPEIRANWSGTPGSNRRPSPWQGPDEGVYGDATGVKPLESEPVSQPPSSPVLSADAPKCSPVLATNPITHENVAGHRGAARRVSTGAPVVMVESGEHRDCVNASLCLRYVGAQGGRRASVARNRGTPIDGVGPGLRVLDAQGVGGDPEAILVVLETGLEIGDQVVGQVFPAVVELADMRTPRQRTNPWNAGGRDLDLHEVESRHACWLLSRSIQPHVCHAALR